MNVHTEVDCDVELRVIVQFDFESNTWHYYISNPDPKYQAVEITVDQWVKLGLPYQNPD